MLLEEIQSPDFLKQLNEKQLDELATQIRQFVIESVSKTGGHLSSNLGIVELTMAIHYVFDSPKDKILFDVGHQSYIHKILTGRASQFSSLRKTDGLSGFQKRCESIHDVWEAGHSSTALSAALAMAVARDLDKEDYDVIPVIGDGAILGGESLEALNHLSAQQNKVIVVLNDNQMSIGKVIGDASGFVSNIRTSNTYNHLKNDYRELLSKGNIGKAIFKMTSSAKNAIKSSLSISSVFDDFGIRHLGPVDGHNIKELIAALQIAKESSESVLIHVITKKGKGYLLAERDITGKWHGTGPFDIDTGISTQGNDTTKISWSKVVSFEISKLMQKDNDIVAITPAMVSGSAMERLFEQFPNRCFDVGIAEQHALTFTAGLSISNKKPFISVYSSFIQRAYDQINHDIARMNLPCFICIDRAGIVGADGPTHHGVFDISIFTPIPNIVYFAPSNALEAKSFINYAFSHFDKPYLMRIPRGNVNDSNNNALMDMKIGTWTQQQYGKDIVIITYGDNVEIIQKMVIENNIMATVVNARFIKPMDEKMLLEISSWNIPIIIYETDLQIGGLFQNISSYFHKNNIIVKLHSIAIEDRYSMQGSIDDIYKDEAIDVETVKNRCKEILQDEGKN